VERRQRSARSIINGTVEIGMRCVSDLLSVREAVVRFIMIFVAIVTAATASAQTTQAQAPEPADQETDVSDLIREWRHKTPAPPPQPGQLMIVAAPIIGSNPSAGFLVGAAAQLAVYCGDPTTTRISSGIAALTISTKKQISFNVRFDTFSQDDRWFVEGDNRFQSTSQSIYGLGTDTLPTASVETLYGFVRLHETVYRQAAKDFYIGGGFLFDSHTNVRPANGSDPSWSTSPYIVYSEQNGLPTSSQQSAGFSVNALLNRRDNDINPSQGWMVSGRYRASFGGFLGGDSSWQALDADARAYIPLDESRRHRLAFWTYTSLVTAGVAPYFDLPATVMDAYGRSARAYQDGRFRGQQLVYGEVEYRGPLTSNNLLGMVAFANLTTVSDKQTGEQLFESVAPAAGGGLRLLLNKHSKTNLCLDLAWGKAGSKGVYLAIEEAF
jgi:hypothetical protein